MSISLIHNMLFILSISYQRSGETLIFAFWGLAYFTNHKELASFSCKGQNCVLYAEQYSILYIYRPHSPYPVIQ